MTARAKPPYPEKRPRIRGMRLPVHAAPLLAPVVRTAIVAVGDSAAADSAAASTQRCSPAQLRGSAALQGATGSQLGGVLVTNEAATPCQLPATPPRVWLVWRGRRLAVRQVPIPRGWLDSEYPRGSTRMRFLRPGQSTYVVLQWWNWCGLRPWGRGYFRGDIEMKLPGSAGILVARLHETAAPYCNAPPSILRVSGFLRRA